MATTKSIKNTQLVLQLDKIVSLRKKYGNTRVEYKINDKILLRFDDKKNCYIYYNNNKLLKWNYGVLGAMYEGAKTGITWGLIGDGPVIYLTSDKTVRNAEVSEEIIREIKSSLKRLEQEMKNDSMKKWGK